jgi:long-chain acyl-CoA synthetase
VTRREHHLGELADRAAERRDPDRPAVLFEGRWWTSGQLHDRARRAAGGLRDRLELQPGDRVAVVMATTPDVGVLYQACWRAGLVAVPVLFLLPPAELRRILIDAGCRAVLTTPEFVANVATAAADLDVRILVDGDGAGQHPSLDELFTADPAGITDRDDHDLAALLYTGGTTGRAKGVELSHAALWHAGRAGYLATVDDRLHRTLVPLPLAHAFGLLVAVTGSHDPEPSQAVLLRWFEPHVALQAIADHRLQQATMVPTMLRLLLDHDLEAHDLSSLERIVCGSAPLAPSVLEAFESRVPSVTICEGYGLTETAAAATVNRRRARRVGTVGTALPGVELRVVGPDDQPVPAGEPGEVLIRSAGTARRYHGIDDDPTFAPDGEGGVWVRTGDVGALDDDGYLTILDRAKDVIIRHGFNVYPRDVEEVLVTHDAVAAAGVIGRPDERVGEEIVAVVQPTVGHDLDVDQLLTWARERLGPKSAPREVRVVDALPLTPVLKIDRKALRELA